MYEIRTRCLWDELQSLQTVFCLAELRIEGLDSFELFAFLIDNGFGCFGYELFVLQLAFRTGNILLDLGLLLRDTGKFLFGVDQLSHGHIQLGVGSDAGCHLLVVSGICGKDFYLISIGQTEEERDSGLKDVGLDVVMNRLHFLEGGTFISERRLRMARMASIMDSMAASSALKFRASLYSGHLAMIRASPS